MREATEIKVYWDSQDPHNESWAYRLSDDDGMIESGGLDAEDIYDAIDEAISISSLDYLTADMFAIEPHVDGGWAIWTKGGV